MAFRVASGSVKGKRRSSRATAAAGAADEEVPQAWSLRAVARRLDYMIGQVTPDEFAWQDANYDRDSALGRELLFLMANDEWVRSTSEIIDIARPDAIETAIDFDIDLSRITHEAFRDRSGQIWLPIVLPPLRQTPPGTEPFSTLAVVDAFGNPLVPLPRADVRRRLAAGLAEIIVNVAAARLSDVGDQEFAGGRDHRLVLSAAIYRLLRDETVPAPLLISDGPVRPASMEPMGQIDRARHEVGAVLTAFAGLLTEPDLESRGGWAAARQLAERALLVLSALTRSAIIVIRADRVQPPTVLSVRLPGRALHRATARWADVFGPAATSHRRWASFRTWWRKLSRIWRRLRITNWIFPSASWQLDVLLPSAEADRQVRVNLPGISPDPSLAMRTQFDVRCERPFPMRQLATVTSQLLQADPDWPSALRQSLADLALAKADAVEAILRDHHVGAGPAREAFGPDRAVAQTRDFRARLGGLRSALREIATRHGDSGAAHEALTRAWAGGGWLAWPMQRRTSIDTISPGVVAARARVIDDARQRSAVTSARMEVRFAVTDSTYLAAARQTGRINALLMFVVLLFFSLAHELGFPGRQVSPEVLVLVLTLYSAIRLRLPDRSTARGVLEPSGVLLIIFTILPTVILAVAIALFHSLAWIMTWAGSCLALQLSEQWLMRYIQRRAPSLGVAAQSEPGLLLYTDAPDYSHDVVLHSNWWRRTTAEALMLGRPAYGYLIWQHDNQQELSSLLAGYAPKSQVEQPVNVLALLRSGTWAQGLNFVMLREQLDRPPGNTVQVDLDPGLLTLSEDATSMISIFLGVPADAEAKIAQHPITVALRMAAALGLVVSEIQLPIPAPELRYAHLLWGRVQLNVRPEQLDHIQDFMASLIELTTTTVVAIRSRTDGKPRILNPLPRPAGTAAESGSAGHSRLVLATDLDVVARSGARHDDDAIPAWRLMALCADWRMGIEAQMLAGLDPDLVLVGLTNAILCGQSVLVLLCRGARQEAASDDPALLRAAFFNCWQSRDELGIAPPHPLLRVHVRTPDRPSATIAVLKSLHDAIDDEFPHVFNRRDLNVWYAQAMVRDGNMAHVKLTIVLPIDLDSGTSPAAEWDRRVFARLEHRALASLALRMADGDQNTESVVTPAEAPPATVIRLGLVRMPDSSMHAQSQAD